ncbi:hypothetical protein CI1B_68200 [Bradyrhizobium ivorense]|uniref:Uncharacterized protein n=1 Tax=Bradyrhizobium ivorense TaxID=2511166 RepID=A0A508TRX1_9BRAD|nr:hypothetical protein [Bradyrhizobium ivorense]VIO76944.1 hypothetical protein CI1B_68200 [Bradyrhizobium ivorense]
MKYLTIATTVAALAGAGPGQAGAETISSSYSSTAPKACRMIGKPNDEDGSATRVCPGKYGLVVLINEGDLREVVSVGRNREAAAKEPAAQAWFGPFSSTGDTVEWRAADNKPFAIIQRWLIADNSEQDKRGGPVSRAMLAVTRLPPGAVCHIAYVDVAANPNANALARQAADEFARDFNCGKDSVKTIGQSGRSTALVKR